ncbi:hypothetical protein ASG33_20845 [Dyadobacter sp. Leaf189]|nr:hypothetical protein ASG33_20845 [Dyadobacter sp. Leaf189]
MIESFNPDYPNRNFTGGINFSVNNPGIGFNEVLAVHKHDFAGPDEEPIEWRTGVFEFTPKATTAILQVEIIQEADDDNEYGVVGLDLGPNTVVPCIAGTQAVPLKATSHEILCPETSVNLVSQFFGGLIPSGTELKFFTNPNHTGLPLSNLNVGAGTYYAFYYDAANNCYNQDVSTAKIDVTYKNCADVTQTLDISAANFSLGVSRDFVVNLYEINGSGTAGPVTFKIGKPGGFTITYPTVSGVSKIFGDVPNENGKWTFSENAGFITATSSEPIPANGQATIGFRVARKAGIAAGLSQNITITVVGGSGGELNTENNLSITTVSTN